MAQDSGPHQRSSNKHDVEIAKHRAQTHAMLIDRGARLLDRLLVVGVVGVGLYYLGNGVLTFTGQPPGVWFQKLFHAVSSVSLDRIVSWVTTGGVMIAFAREKKLRLKLVSEKAEYELALERKVDPERSSSGLLKQGTPPKEE